MDAFTPEAVSRMVANLQLLHDELGQYMNDAGHKPVQNSQAAGELMSFEHPESVITAYSQGSVLIEVVADQTMAFSRTVTEPVQTIAPWTCVRAALEAAAIAIWLLDRNLTAEGRVQRSFAFRYEGLTQQAKWGRALGDAAGAAKVMARVDDVERLALNLGYPRIEDNKGQRTGIGQQMPNVTELIRDTLNEEAMYRLLSAVAHAHHWALQQLSFRHVENSNKLDHSDNTDARVLPFEKNLDPRSVALLISKAVRALSIPVWNKGQLYGWDTEHLGQILDRAFTTMQIREEMRFWKVV